MNKSYLHISYEPPVYNWLPRIMARLRESSSVTLRTCMEGWSKTPIREMGLAFSTKLAVLPVVVDRVDKRLQRLSHHMANEAEEVQRCIRRGSAYMVPERMLPYEILLDIDSFIFESRSVYEIAGKLLVQFHSQILGQRISENDLKSMIVGRGIDDRWIEELKESRKLFFHQTAPWIALEVKSLDPARFELLILKRDLRDFSDPHDYISLDQLRSILNGFYSSMGLIYEWLLDKIGAFEKAEMT